MRTKTLLLSAALSFACVATSMAQVFSANIVGYYNKTIPANQFAILANQLRNGTNGLDQVLSGAQDGDLIYTWTGSGYVSYGFTPGFGWDPTTQIPPGTGFFYKNVNKTNAVTVTFVGEVPTGSVTNSLPPGLSLKGAVIPQAGDLGVVHNLQGNDGDLIYRWAGTGFSSQVPGFTPGFGWDPPATVTVGEGFFYKNTTKTNAPVVWTRTFNP